MRTTNLARLGAITSVLALLLMACGDGGNGGEAEREGPTIVLRGQAFEESITLAEAYGQYLRAQGYDVQLLTPAGFREEAYVDLEQGTVNFVVDYLGGAQAYLLPDAPPSVDAEEVAATITPELAAIGATVLDFAPAANGDALVVRGDDPARTISDLADGSYVLGASAQCFERPQCFLGLTDPDVYGIEFANTRTIEYGPLLGEALAAGEADVVVWEETAAQIEEFGFRVLEDDGGLLPVQNIFVVVSDELIEAYGDDFLVAVNALSSLITTEDLQQWNFQTNIELREPDDVAADWLAENNIV